MASCLLTQKSPLVLMLTWGGGVHPWLLFSRGCHNRTGETAKTSSVCLASTLSREMECNCTAARGNSELGLVKQYNPYKASNPSVPAFSVRRVRLPPLSEGGGVTGEMSDFIPEPLSATVHIPYVTVRPCYPLTRPCQPL